MNSRIPVSHWLLNRPVAHRGLWDETVPENSLVSYERACAAGYPIEIDVHLTRDGEIVILHDDDLKRLCGVEGLVADKTLAELKQLRLLGSEETVPLLSEALKAVRGRVPFLIEIKGDANRGLEEKLVSMLRAYRGEFAIQSFNPFILKKIRKLAPDFLRGILATWYYPAMPKWKQAFLRSLKSCMFAKPDFVSYDVNHLPNKYVAAKKLPLLCWTVRSVPAQRKAKSLGGNIIFENFIPE